MEAIEKQALKVPISIEKWLFHHWRDFLQTAERFCRYLLVLLFSFRDKTEFSKKQFLCAHTYGLSVTIPFDDSSDKPHSFHTSFSL